MAIALTSGATCLDDLNILNPLVATGLSSTIASTPTAHRRCHQLAERIDVVDDRLVRAARTLHTRAWGALGDMDPIATATREDPLIIDVDASLIHIHSDPQ